MIEGATVLSTERSSYSLHRRRSADALGETFFARPAGAPEDSLSYVRIFQIPGLSDDALLRGAWERREALQGLDALCADDLGSQSGRMCAFYDCAPASSLMQALAAATARDAPIPLDQALLVTLDLARLLAPAVLRPEPRWHGFLVPHLVLISWQGDIRLAGFEVGVALAKALVHTDAVKQFESHLSAEVLAGQTPGPADDVYSLGAMLLEIVTGQPPKCGGNSQLEVAASQLVDGSPIPDQLAALLHRSLAPAGERVPNVARWLAELERIVSDEQHRASPRSLGLLVESLCADESKPFTDLSEPSGQQQSGAPVKIIESPLRANASATSEALSGRRDADALFAAPPDPSAQEDVVPPAGHVPAELLESPGEHTVVPSSASQDRAANRLLWPIVGLVGAALVPAAFFYKTLSRPALESEPPATTITETGELTPTLPDTPRPTIEDVDTTAAAGSTGRIERSQAGEGPGPDFEPATLDSSDGERSSTPARDPAYSTDRPATREQEAPAIRGARAAPRPAVAPVSRGEADAAEQRTTQAADSPERHPPQPRPGPIEANPQSPPLALQEAGRSVKTPQPGQSTAAAGSPTGDSVAADRPQTPSVRVDELVERWPGVTLPQLIERPTLKVPKRARRLNKRVVVQVRVLVDENGRVQDVALKSERVGFKLDEAALEAARRAIYRPAHKNGVPVKIWTDLTFAIRVE